MHTSERRRPNRPVNGDTKACPKCGGETCEFSERYRLADVGVTPAWICDSPQCRYRDVVRKNSRPAASRELIRASRDLQGRVRREMLKCRTLVERSHKHVSTGKLSTRKKHA